MMRFEKISFKNKTKINMFDGGINVGSIDLYYYKSDNLTWIGNFEIKKQFRGQGLGTKLFNYALQKGANALCVKPDNKVAIHMYKTSGFKKVGQNKDMDIMLHKSAKPSESFLKNLAKTK